jgi:hypothetical protein
VCAVCTVTSQRNLLERLHLAKGSFYPVNHICVKTKKCEIREQMCGMLGPIPIEEFDDMNIPHKI